MRTYVRIYRPERDRCRSRLSRAPLEGGSGGGKWLTAPMPGSSEYGYWRTVLRIAALCHDIGHLPFSHAAERELLPDGWDHERVTFELIRSSARS